MMGAGGHQGKCLTQVIVLDNLLLRFNGGSTQSLLPTFHFPFCLSGCLSVFASAMQFLIPTLESQGQPPVLVHWVDDCRKPHLSLEHCGRARNAWKTPLRG